MATIVLLHHEMSRHVPNVYVSRVIAERWRESGHRVLEHFGTENPPEADVAFLHVDLTIVPEEYRLLGARYRRVINGSVMNISKSSFSQHLVTRDSDWGGPVIVKTDANYFGRPELIVQTLAQRTGAANATSAGPVLPHYPVFAAPSAVPAIVWQTPGLIVEKFLPEQDAHGYYMRNWTFLGNRERNIRNRSQNRIIKRDNVVEREEVPVPDEIRVWREKLRFDFGKFDYVIHQGRPILLDVNKTPGARPLTSGRPEGRRSLLALAEGLECFLR